MEFNTWSKIELKTGGWKCHSTTFHNNRKNITLSPVFCLVDVYLLESGGPQSSATMVLLVSMDVSGNYFSFYMLIIKREGCMPGQNYYFNSQLWWKINFCNMREGQRENIYPPGPNRGTFIVTRGHRKLYVVHFSFLSFLSLLVRIWFEYCQMEWRAFLSLSPSLTPLPPSLWWGEPEMMWCTCC